MATISFENLGIIRIIKRCIGSLLPACEREWTRDSVADRYLHGEGIEIGALHKPLNVPSDAKVRYLDRMPAEALRKHYPELNGSAMVSVDIVDDGESLTTVGDDSLDFVIANHFLEHCQNPIKAVSNMLRVLKHDGVLYLAIPDKRLIFDRLRPVTEVDHIIRDFREGPGWSRKSAFEEYVRFVDGLKDGVEANERIARYMSIDYSIHYHAWTEIEMIELMIFLRKSLGIPFRIELMLKYDVEVIMILKKGV